ncbi:MULTISPECIES: HypC/HybG/HupF family hydrogenase formation chaperone [Carboxydocella]|uniref:Hydrogenase expression/formation protein HypC n=2 Tax=Carboxydocella TaxID=178898 RepID=A0A1T4LQI4_9FIRM|nr:MULTISPECIES: HypC/HybG/HupF family hydrogenase formation chaperone [Carboxydocella]AVX20561.1 Hydrogenase maturation protein HypC [Carboxydocella thermautotrophica]AVX30983.1 Hydrogenase maturation protein HypC [Carboxydocella thermautotrophica]SJZ56897.1 hydrogenase expression/formation protein HypC [Carboxydocella sporoproducens DSM 16521]GAW29621.1 hydrogenase assembly protein HypC [Carboxydocella sp. ULO1]GAW31488.1 hydrogenase assembly protein HypC [Carboxydocella sp. JDF658]
MCLAVPGKLIEKKENTGVVELMGVKREVSLILCPSASVNDYVLVHAGFVIDVVDEEAALATIKLLQELEEKNAEHHFAN